MRTQLNSPWTNIESTAGDCVEQNDVCQRSKLMVSFEFENQVKGVLSASVGLKATQKADNGYSGLIFMLIVCREYLYPLHVFQLTPSAILSCSPRRYWPLGLAVWQLLYQKPPLKEVAHWPLAKSLSTSLVENCIPLWEDKESPEKNPQY